MKNCKNMKTLLLFYTLFTINIDYVMGKSVVPFFSLKSRNRVVNNITRENMKFLPFIMLVDKDKDTSEYWRETEILTLVRNNDINIDYEKCEQSHMVSPLVQMSSRRTVRPICRGRIEQIISPRQNDPCICDRYRPQIFKHNNRTYIHHHKCPCLIKKLEYRKRLRRRINIVKRSSIFPENNQQLCPQCSHFNNHTECELFRDSCKERRVQRFEYHTYCDRKYGRWRTMFLPSDYSQCRCCDECIFYRELDQSCIQDEYNFDAEEFLPVTTIDFRAGCNPYWGHPEQESRSLRCDRILRRCVPVTIPPIPNESLTIQRHNFRYEPASGGKDCPISCRGYDCFGGLVREQQCTPGAYLPDKDHCNCCGRCSSYYQINEKCAEFKKTVHNLNGTKEIEVEEEFLDPGCDDGLVCRQGRCQDIHTIETSMTSRKKRDNLNAPYEPCKLEMKHFKKKYGADGHLHFEAPQCTPLWLYAPVQCRRFICYCALEDGTMIQGIKVPRVEVSNMNCDCARERCRTGSDVECDGYGNYKEAMFTAHVDEWKNVVEEFDGTGTTTIGKATPSR